MSDDALQADARRQPDQFVRLFLAHQAQILSYVASLVPHPADAEDLVQEVSIVLWEKFADFEPGTDFGAWARRIAYLKVLNFRRSRKARYFSDVLVETLARSADCAHDLLERQREALTHCLPRLPRRQRDLLRLRYQGRSRTLKATAEQIGRSEVTIRKLLRLAYGALLECINRRLRVEEG